MQTDSTPKRDGRLEVSILVWALAAIVPITAKTADRPIGEPRGHQFGVTSVRGQVLNLDIRERKWPPASL